MADAVARAWLTGTPEEPIINLDLPAGPKGEPGGWTTGSSLSTRNLNDITSPGLYYQGSTANAMNAELNYPPMADFAGSARGVLEVVSWSGGAAVIQRYTRIGRGASSVDQPRVTYTRYRESVWSPWTSVAPTQIVLDSQGFKTYQTWDEGKNVWETTSGPGGSTTGDHLNKLHLDTVTTAGDYRQTQGPDASLSQGYPVASVGVLSVRTRIPSSDAYGPSVVQEYSPIFGVPASESRVLYRRTQTGKVWQPWRSFSSQRVDSTAGRVIYTWDDTANREQLIYGDTGWRNIGAETSLMINDFVNTSVQLRRVGYYVTLNFDGFKSATATGNIGFIQLPDGFKPDLTNGSGNQRYGLATELSGLNPTVISPEPSYGSSNSLSGVLRFLSYPSTRVLHGSVSFYTRDPWPSVLPGTAIGVAPNV